MTDKYGMRRFIDIIAENAQDVLWHGSTAKFDITQARPLTHFGSRQGATHRIYTKRAEETMGRPRSLTVGYLYPAHLNITNPLKIRDRKELKHSTYKLTDMLHYELKAISREEREEIMAQQCSPEAIVEVLSRKGYDGFVYENAIEDAGHLSYVIFDSSQITPAGPRETYTNVGAMTEGEVIDLKQHKTQKAFGDYATAVQGIYAAEADFFARGKFSPFAHSYIESGFKEEFRPQVGLMVYFRDYRLTPVARELLTRLTKERPKWDIRRTKYHQDYQGTKSGPVAHLDDISLERAREIWVNRNESEFGAYCPSRSGFRTVCKENWDENGVGFSMLVGGQDGRRGDKYGNATREEWHIIDNDEEMKEVVDMFAIIRRARMVAK